WTWSQPTTDWSQYNIFFADVDGDGSFDMFLQGAGAQCYKSCVIGAYLALSTGKGFNTNPWTWSLPTTNWGKWDISFADFDGDRRADLYLHDWYGSTGAQDYMALSTGAGFTIWSWNSGADWSRYLAVWTKDVNGDGKADLYLHGKPDKAIDELGLGIGVTPDLVTSVTHPLGSTATIGY